MLKEEITPTVPRLSSRVFLGKPLCRDVRWLEIATTYTTEAFISARLLRLVPAPVRPVAHCFLPHCIRIRKAYRNGANLIQPEIERRRARAQALLAEGKKSLKTEDTIGWMVEIQRGRDGKS
jgi:hypothetical protein